jgi:hypothetical protein
MASEYRSENAYNTRSFIQRFRAAAEQKPVLHTYSIHGKGDLWIVAIFSRPLEP